MSRAATEGAPAIAVVGAGPTGLTLACLLHRHGVPCRVLDKGTGPTTLSRALGMFTRSLEVLEEFGAAEKAIERGHSIAATNIYSGRRRIARMRTGSLTGTRRAAILSLPQYETEALLEERFEQLGGRVERETAVREVRPGPAGGGVTLALEGPSGAETLEADWVVGADGAHSAVRKSLGIGFPGEATKDVFVIVDAFVDDGPAYHEVHYYFSRQGLTVVSPLPDRAFRFAASMTEPIGDGSAVELEIIQELLERRIGGGIRIRELRDAGWGPAQVRVHTRVADEYRHGRCVLAGDAAHVYSPLGGQGMNGGIQDAYNLAWKLALVATGKAREPLLDSYAVERRAIAQDAQRLVAGQARLGSVRSRLGVALRDAAVLGASRAGLLERQMLPRSVMLAHRYPQSPAVTAGRRRGPQGRRIPDVVLEQGSGVPLRLFDLLRRRPFTLLALAPSDCDLEDFDELAASTSDRYGDLVAVVRVLGGSEDGPGLVDREGELHRFLRVSRPSVCLIRADTHVALFAPLAARSQLDICLERLLAPSRAPVDPAAH